MGYELIIEQIGTLQRLEVVYGVSPFRPHGEQLGNGLGALYSGEHGQIVARGELDAAFGIDFLKLGGILFTGDVVGYEAVLRFGFVVTINDEVTLEVNRQLIIMKQAYSPSN